MLCCLSSIILLFCLTVFVPWHLQRKQLQQQHQSSPSGNAANQAQLRRHATNSAHAGCCSVPSAEVPRQTVVPLPQNNQCCTPDDAWLYGQKSTRPAQASGKDASDDDTLTLYRYYHVFWEQEFLALCQAVRNGKLLQHYYDCNNWAGIFQRT